MAMQTTAIEYEEGGTTLEGFLAYDDSFKGPRPAVLIAPAWNGRDELMNKKAQAIAELGYVGFALDMYGKGVLGKNIEENAKLMQPFMEDRGKLQARMNAALTTVKSLEMVDDSRVAVMGFCFGGLCALDLARTGADIKGAITFHSLFKPADNIREPDIKAKVLMLHGSNDPMATMEQAVEIRDEMNAAGADWQMVLYGGCMHGFTNPNANMPDMGLKYNADADRRSWRALQNFLEEIFA